MRHTRSTREPLVTDCFAAGKNGTPILTYELVASQWRWSGPCMEGHHTKFGDHLAGIILQVWSEVAGRHSGEGVYPVRFAWYETQRGSFLVVNVQGGSRTEYPSIRGIHVIVLPGGEPAPLSRFGVSIPIEAAARIRTGADLPRLHTPGKLPKKPRTRKNPAPDKKIILSCEKGDDGQWRFGGALMKDATTAPFADTLAQDVAWIMRNGGMLQKLTAEEQADLVAWEVSGVFADLEKADRDDPEQKWWQQPRLTLYVGHAMTPRILGSVAVAEAAKTLHYTISEKLKVSVVPMTSRSTRPPPAPTIEDFYGKPISEYTRAQALEDGVLVDLAQFAPDVVKQHYKAPSVAATAAVWSIIDKAVKNPNAHNSYNGVIHDILWMSRTYRRQIAPNMIMTRLTITGAGKKRLYDLKLVFDEDGITVMLPNED